MSPKDHRQISDMGSCCSESTPKSGRPQLYTREEREELILDAVGRVVADKGLQGASMAAIAREAGMSKRTLYAVCESRDALFESWVQRLRASFMRPLTEEERALPIEERLRRLLGRDVRDEAKDPRQTVLRSVIAEAPRHPELARTFYREGPEAAEQILAVELEIAMEKGEIVIDNAREAARMLMNMVHSTKLCQLLDPDAKPETAAERQARLKWAVRVFLYGVRAAASVETG